MIKDADKPRLSQRETQVLSHIAEGLINREIAVRMNVSPDTVDTYCRRIFTKLDVSDRLSAVLSGISHGILKPGDQVMMDSIQRRKRPLQND